MSLQLFITYLDFVLKFIVQTFFFQKCINMPLYLTIIQATFSTKIGVCDKAGVQKLLLIFKWVSYTCIDLDFCGPT